jgi:hypothetical protein
MPQVEFELTMPIVELAKTVYALDRAATLIGVISPLGSNTLLSKFFSVSD